AVQGDGERAAFPAGENVHEPEILRETIAPARASETVRDRAQSVAREVLGEMEGRSAYGIELFAVDGDILVNEIAPRVHNSGHYTIEGAVTSQFEQHVRAVVGYPLGSTALRDPVVMANVLGDVEEPRPANLLGADRVFETPGASLHWYGKREARPLRKMGHVTVVPTAGEDRAELLETARDLTDSLTFE
ncbi:MAG: ATP-grasp domain-containing protein, partial [Halobacteriales archaeon]